jgi:hypothetical protein
MKQSLSRFFQSMFKKKSGSDDPVSVISPGRVSAPEDNTQETILTGLHDSIKLVTPSFRTELIPLIRDLYKVNPDVSIALQDMFKLANTGHEITFPNNTPKEAEKMRNHLLEARKKWSKYTAGIDGLVNKFIVQLLVGGAISVEGVPNKNLDGLSTILFLNPENIKFRRLNDGVYHPYQRNCNRVHGMGEEYIKLNTETYLYIGMYNDTDEPYGVPPFMAALDSIAGQHTMRKNFKHIMELMGLVGFLEVKMTKPAREPNESSGAYKARLKNTLRDLKRNIRDGMNDGVVAGYSDDHEFKMNSTTSTLSNINLPWDMNQQSVANGLGVNGSIIGTNNSKNGTEGGAGIALSKMISQLRNIQKLLKFALEFFYSLELRLAGFNNKGINIIFHTSTVSDEVKVQQALEYKIRNLNALYDQGIISQFDYAWAMGYDSPDQDEPRVSRDTNDTEDVDDSAKSRKREEDKDKSDRKTRDKNNPNPKRKDQDSKPR